MRIGACLVCVLATLCAYVHAAASATQAALLRDARKSPTGVLRLNERTYAELLAAPRDYAVFVQMTAMGSRFRCSACSMMREPFEQAARGWKAQKQRDKLVFAVVDVDDALNLFRQLGLTYVPVLHYFAPSVGGAASPPENYDATTQGFEADNLAAFVAERIGVPFQPKKPLLPRETLLYLIPVAFCIAIVTVVMRQRSWRHVFTTLGLMACVGFVLTHTSGYMWTRIHSSPFMLSGPNGRPVLFSMSFQAQLGIESLLMVALYASLTACLLVLTRVAPKIASPVWQRVTIAFAAISMLLLYGMFTKAFVVKNPMYPFRFLL